MSLTPASNVDTKFSGQVRHAFNARMNDEGWQLESICELLEAHTRKSLVTPFFSSEIRNRGVGVCTITGALGVVHRDFEAEWSKITQPATNSFCFALLSLNVPELVRTAYIQKETLETDVERFCNALIKFLNQLPCSRSSLALMFHNKDVAGIRLENFMVRGMINADKLCDFRRFVAAS